MVKDRRYLLLVLLLYYIFAIFVLFAWEKQDAYPVTGDEPHYLVMTKGIAKNGTFEQTLPYKEEFQTRNIFIAGLAPKDAIPTPDNTHAVKGPHGLYNVHSVGLPLLLLLPFSLGGILATKMFLVAVSGMIVVVLWKISGLFVRDLKVRVATVVPLTIGLPLLPASNQIYPDIIAGLIALSGFYWLLTFDKKRPFILKIFYSLALAFLPWLQIKFAAVLLVLSFGIALEILKKEGSIHRLYMIVVPVVLSFIGLALYNYYAFGKVTGPYHDGALTVNKNALMVLCGQFLDQNQGFLMQNPIFFLGIFSIGLLFAYNRNKGFVWLLAFLALIVPNALHPNWYGGGSFSGRFAWAAAIFFMTPTIMGLARISKKNWMLFRFLVGLGVGIQLIFYCIYTGLFVNLYNKPPETWLSEYSLFYFPLHNYFPAFYNIEWAFDYAPNYCFLFIVLLLFFLGVARCPLPKIYQNKFVVNVSWCIVFGIIFLIGFSTEPNYRSKVFKAKELPSQSGRIEGVARVAESNFDKAGFIIYGPYTFLRKGEYRVSIKYESSASENNPIGKWDIYRASDDKKLFEGLIWGTNANFKIITTDFEICNWSSMPYEFRVYWFGSNDIKVSEIELNQQT